MRIFIAAAALSMPAAAHAESGRLELPESVLALAADPTPTASAVRDGDGIPDQLNADQRRQYAEVFAAIRGQRWEDAQQLLDAMRPGILHPIARAELYTAAGSPRVELQPLLALLEQAPELPQAGQLSRLADLRGATTTPSLPREQSLRWFNGAPVRQRLRSISTNSTTTEVILAMQPYIKADDGAGAEALLGQFAPDLPADALTEWQQKVAWIYYAANDDANARRMAAQAQQGVGDFAALGDWVQGLAAWRQGDCEGAAEAFNAVSVRAGDGEMRSAGLYWLSRADMACGHPERVAPSLKAAAQYGETFYGMLAQESLGISDRAAGGEAYVVQDWRSLERYPNIRVAAALIEIGENGLADEVLRHQARLETAEDHPALVRLAGRLNLPETQLWLSHNAPSGTPAAELARYPAPNWTPDGGWRVDRALVYAHTLQESRFRADVRSAAGAMGLMQVKQGAAIDISRDRGVNYANADLTDPSVNMEVGQSYLEQLRSSSFTGGLLPKVIAAYNAGPTPVSEWNATVRDNGDPLLYIESIPYWETRGYVMIVLRNYWMYERQEGKASASRAALAQGLWPRFPGMPGESAVRMSAAPGFSAASGAN
ncbi:lytic transglycosylase domain-containing protein [Stakelama tenebrarum]|nr:lytic transglycosylase domain-containing protein [Sphingosinithalassobacter tenebrarum]